MISFFIYLQKKYTVMQTTERVQTVLRLPKPLYERVKMKAAKENLSFNAYVETALDKFAGLKLPKIPKDYKIADEILALVPKKSSFTMPSKEELEKDPKLAYLIEKNFK